MTFNQNNFKLFLCNRFKLIRMNSWTNLKKIITLELNWKVLYKTCNLDTWNSSTHRENYFWFMSNQPKSDCVYYFLNQSEDGEHNQVSVDLSWIKSKCLCVCSVEIRWAADHRGFVSSGFPSERINLSPFTKDFRGGEQLNESLKIC